MRMRLLKSLGRRFVGTALLFSGLVSIGTSLVLLLSSCVGYLPYSDRPGPGWWGRVHWPSWGEFTNYIEFAPWFAYFCIYFGLGLFGLSLVLGVASTPRWLNRLLGGVIAAMAGGLAVSGAGWYLALAAIGPYAAVVCGLGYGIFLFPRFVQQRAEPIALWMRIVSVTCATIIFLYWIASPFLPREPTPSVNYDLVRITAGGKTVVTAPYLGAEIARELSDLNVKGEPHGGIGGVVGTGQNVPSIDVELIALEPIRKDAQLAIPKAGYVVYVLKGGYWSAHPSFSNKDRRTITIKPGVDIQFDGGQVKFGDEPHFTPFTWSPVIPKGQ